MKMITFLMAASLTTFVAAQAPKTFSLKLGASDPLPPGANVLMVVRAGHASLAPALEGNGEATRIPLSENDLLPKETAPELAVLRAVADAKGNIPSQEFEFTFPNFTHPQHAAQASIITFYVTTKITKDDKILLDEPKTIRKIVKFKDDQITSTAISIYSRTNKSGETVFGIASHPSNKALDAKQEVIHGVPR